MDSENLNREELLKLHQRRRLNIITNVILIIVLLVIIVYVIYNVEHIKLLSGDVCKLCLEKNPGLQFYKINQP